MRTLFLQTMVSLDGYIGGPNGEIGWHNFDEETAEYIAEMFRSIDAMVFGRKTFDIMAACWPTATGLSAKPRNELPKLVFSRTPKTTTWSNARVAGPSVRRDPR